MASFSQDDAVSMSPFPRCDLGLGRSIQHAERYGVSVFFTRFVRQISSVWGPEIPILSLGTGQNAGEC